MARVFIGVGHGGPDPGAVAAGIKESEANLQMALGLKAELERHGVTVGISRTRDEEDRLAEEISEANAFRPDLAVEVHNNAGGGDGWECYRQTSTAYGQQSLRLGKAIEARVPTISGGCDRSKLPQCSARAFLLTMPRTGRTLTQRRSRGLWARLMPTEYWTILVSPSSPHRTIQPPLRCCTPCRWERLPARPTLTPTQSSSRPRASTPL